MKTEQIKGLRTPPASALKKIQAGRLKGKSDINPQWRIDVMNQQFGICGLGWKYEITRQWLEPGANNEVMAFCNVSIYIKDGDNWSAAIPGTGGSSLIASERNGMYNSDEAYKMALTDALSVAMKGLGVAADVYRGLMDGSKYSKPAKPQVRPMPKPTLKESQILEAMQRIEGGELALIDKISAKFLISEDLKKAMIEAANRFKKLEEEVEAEVEVIGSEQQEFEL